MLLLLVMTGLGLVSADLFGSPPLVSTPPPWESRSHDQSPTGLYGSTGHPFPTNVWWQNMVLDQGDLVNTVNPYIVKTMKNNQRHYTSFGQVEQGFLTPTLSRAEAIA